MNVIINAIIFKLGLSKQLLKETWKTYKSDTVKVNFINPA